MNCRPNARYIDESSCDANETAAAKKLNVAKKSSFVKKALVAPNSQSRPARPVPPKPLSKPNASATSGSHQKLPVPSAASRAPNEESFADCEGSIPII